MAFPSFSSSVILEETGSGTSHTLPPFSATASGNTLYAVFAVGKKQIPSQISVSGWTTPETFSAYYVYQSGINKNVTIVRVYRRATGNSEGSLTLTTADPCVVAAVGARFTGTAAATLGETDADEMLPIYPISNPAEESQPGISHVGESDKVPNRSGNTGPQVDATVVHAFARTGKTVFKTDFVDPIGSGASHGAPYLATRNRDLQWSAQGGSLSGGIDGTNTSPFTTINHAESTNSAGWKVQAGMAYRNVPASAWSGHGTWDPYIYTGQIALTYWPCDNADIIHCPTACCGIRLHV